MSQLDADTTAEVTSALLSSSAPFSFQGSAMPISRDTSPFAWSNAKFGLVAQPQHDVLRENLIHDCDTDGDDDVEDDDDQDEDEENDDDIDEGALRYHRATHFSISLAPFSILIICFHLCTYGRGGRRRRGRTVERKYTAT